ncbi:MAG: NAD(P)H-dependent oxidoreductase [Bacilli bacterium]|nr:NAD(P)H-dependent oxidoreductase [Bacilli bacterium]
MKKIFIYYSLNGSGDVVADVLKEQGVTIRKVKPKKELPKSIIGQILQGGFLAMINHKSKLIDFDKDISKYDEVIIGSPIWNARLSTPINTVLDELDLKDKKVSFIFYSASGTSPKATEKVHKLFPKAEITDLKEPKDNEQELNKI